MHRRTFLGGIACGSALPAASQQTAKRPNVLLLLTDDQRADTIAALGNPHIRTPHLDALAQRSMVFRNAYCMGGNSPAVCTPSRNMLLSGRAYTRFGQLASAEDPNFPVAMRNAGYYTYHRGKRGNTATAIQAKFDTCKYLNDATSRTLGTPGKIIADEAVSFLQSHTANQPFFMYLAFEAPHDPRVPAPADRAYYETRDIPLPRNYLPMHPFDNGEMTIRDELLAPWPRTQEEVRKHLLEYYAVITGLDAQIGRVLQALQQRGGDRDTLIIFSADQGLALGSHGLMGKQNLYDDGMRVPLLIAGPGVKAGRSDALVYLLDLFPTVLDYAGLPQPNGLDGRSFAKCLANSSIPARDNLFFGYRSYQRAIRDQRFKLIAYPQINKLQLFDLAADPDERHDLASHPAQKQRVDGLLQELRKLQSQFGDTLPLQSQQPAPESWQPPEGEALDTLRKRWNMPPVSAARQPGSGKLG